MITLYTFGPYFGLPDGNPFVMKAMLLLKFAGLPCEENRRGTAALRRASCLTLMMKGLSSPIRPLSAFTSRKNTDSIWMPGSRRSKRHPSTSIWL
jgi:hypothetical protein